MCRCGCGQVQLRGLLCSSLRKKVNTFKALEVSLFKRFLTHMKLLVSSVSQMDGWMDGYCTPIKLESVFSRRPNSTLIGVPLAQVLFLDIFLVRQTQRKPASKHIEVSWCRISGKRDVWPVESESSERATWKLVQMLWLHFWAWEIFTRTLSYNLMHFNALQWYSHCLMPWTVCVSLQSNYPVLLLEEGTSQGMLQR